MISALRLPAVFGQRRTRGFTVGVGLGLMLPMAVLLVFSLLQGGDDAGSGEISVEVAEARQALSEFEESLLPLIEDGGATVVYGIRPGIDEIHNESRDDEVLASMAQGWVAAMERVRGDFAAIEVPGFLEETAGLYRQSFDAYQEAAEALLAATRASGTERAEHISEAAEHGTRADDLYDTAKAQLAEHRARLGM